MCDFRFNCPHCQQSLEAPEDMLGTVINCPSCEGSIQLPAPQLQAHPQSPSLLPPSPPPPLSAPSPQNESQKACPFCGESILAVARKCKHCGEYLDEPVKKPGKAVFKASSKFIGLLCSYHVMDSTMKVLTKMKPGQSFETPIETETVMYVKYAGGFGGPIEVKCYANEVNRFSITKSQTGMGCVVSRVDVIDCDA